MKRRAIVPRCLLLLAAAGAACTSSSAPRPRPGGPAPALAAPGRQFEDVTAAAGITHTHVRPVLDHQLDNIMPWVCSVGASAAAADYDRDGWIDLYVTNSHKGTSNYLYRNNGEGTFTDMAARAGVADLNGEDGTGMDCIWLDYDNDGHLDLYVVRWGRNVLLRNQGDGTFTDVTERCFRRRDGSPGTDWANGNAAVALDFNLDGRLDLYVGNYFDEVDLWHLKSTRIMHDDFERARNGGRNFLYRQEPDGSFAEVAGVLGVDDPGWTLAVGSADLNNDGWPDLYCADDFGPDQLFLNSGGGSFLNATAQTIGTDSKKGMNVDFADFNGDGWLDIYVANITTAEYLQEGNMLWHNNGPGPEGIVTFTDVSLETGTWDGGWGWGAKFLDHDNDGDLDIFAVNGFISAGAGSYWYDLASWTVLGQDPAEARNWPAIGTRSFSGYEPDRFWRNDGFLTFTECARELGVASERDGRGIVCFDSDNDGDVDLFVANHDQPPHLYRNRGGPGPAHWLQVALQADPATGVNRDAVGARVTIVTEGGRQMRERDGGNGYCGQSEARLHFGLGPHARVELLEVRWPDGGLQYLEDVAADRCITIRQDPAEYAQVVALDVGVPSPLPQAEPLSRPLPDVPEGDLERVMSDMEHMLRNRPASRSVASRYRALCAASARHERSIAFFKDRLASSPYDADVAIELACAYVDKIPTCGGLAAIVSKGTLARKSLDVLEGVIERDPSLWVAWYCRGMNHLHWPRALRHSDAAAADFRACLRLQERSGAQPAPDHYVRAFIALGDACTKAGRYAEARQAWKDGLAAFPESTGLRDRLAIESDRALLRFVEDARSLQQPIDTDLSFLVE